MIKKKKRVLSLLIGSILLFGLCLSSCQSNTPSTNATIKVPKLVGLTYEEAQDTLNALSLGAMKETKQSDKPTGEVLAQNPAEGTMLAENDTVTLTVSLGPTSESIHENLPSESAEITTKPTMETGEVESSSTLESSDENEETTAPSGTVSPENSSSSQVTKPSKEDSTKPSKEEPTSKAEKYPITYSDSGVSITIYKDSYKNTVCYSAHVILSDYSRLKTCYAKDSAYSREDPFEFAARKNSLLCVNGDASTYKGHIYPGVKGGVIGVDGPVSSIEAIFDYNTGKLQMSPYRNDDRNISDMWDGSWTGFHWMPYLVIDGVVQSCDTSTRAQRNCIGTNGNPGDLWMVVANGRYCDGDWTVESGSPGWTLQETAEYMASLGCTFAYNLDGGDSSVMIYDGEMLDQMTMEKHREVWDFLYISKP